MLLSRILIFFNIKILIYFNIKILIFFNITILIYFNIKIFENMVLRGKLPGPIDIARGKIKTNDISGLQNLKTWFDFAGV